GRRATVGGGRVLDVDPPRRPGPEAIDRLRARRGLAGDALARRLVSERGAVRAADLLPLTGVSAASMATLHGAAMEGAWLLAPEFVDTFGRALREALGAHHAAHPLRPGLEAGEARAWPAPTAARRQGHGLATAAGRRPP